MQTNTISPSEMAKSVHLRYVHSDIPGYSRKKRGDKFIYQDTEGKLIRDPEIHERINNLVLPPAWTDVWICPYPNGHLQSTGYDVRGRKQYRYHSKWSRIRNDRKFDRLYAFGRKLPYLRKQISKDIRKKSLNLEKVCAIALSVMNETFIRVGNSNYEKEYGSYGLTTLKNKHVAITGTTTFFRFKGKKGIQQQITLNNRSLSRLLKNVRELPGHELFQYYDETGTLKKLDSGDINDYLRTHMNEEFTCKDFRTWAGTVVAMQLMAITESFNDEVDAKKKIITVIDGVAEKLGNTRTVCKNYYIHPGLINGYQDKKLDHFLATLRQARDTEERNKKAEKALLTFLASYSKK